MKSVLLRRLRSSGGGGGTPLAAVVISLGQSLNAARGTTVYSSSTWGNAFMPVGGAGGSEWDYFAGNVENCVDWNEVATATTLAEGALQTHQTGMADQLQGGAYSAGYFASVAIGSRGLGKLQGASPRANLYAVTHRLCDLARADGYEPRVMFYSAHGEADAVDGTTENTYYDQAMAYYGMCQLLAAQAMDDPTYVAPVALCYQLTQVTNAGENDRAIKRAIRRVCTDLAGTIEVGAKYQFPAENDRTHQPPDSLVLRGEWVGRMLLAGSFTPLRITGVVLTGASAAVTFNLPIVKDTVFNTGENLNTAAAQDGFEWIDNGTPININSVSYSGNVATLTLNSTPAGTLAQQTCRIAVQTTTATLAAGPTNLSGSIVREDANGWVSDYDPAYTNYNWAIPQTIVGVS